MQTGKLKNIIEEVPTQILEKSLPSSCANFVNILIKYLNTILTDRKTPLYLFIRPDLKTYSEKLNIDPQTLLKSLLFLSTFRPRTLKMKAILKDDSRGLFHILEDEELDDFKDSNIVYHPEDPKIRYEFADRYVHHAFVLKGE